MTGERFDYHPAENTGEKQGAEGANESEFPAFDPDNARKLAAEAVARKHENIFMQAAADSFVGKENIGAVDHVAYGIEKRVQDENVPVFEALKAASNEAQDDETRYAAIDLMNSYIDTKVSYDISKDELVGRGFANGLVSKLEMRLDTAPTDRPNPAADRIRVDLSYIKPLVQEFVEHCNPSSDRPGAFGDYLRDELEMQEADIISAKRRGESISQEAERKVQALKTAISELADMQFNQSKNLKNLKDSAFAHHQALD